MRIGQWRSVDDARVRPESVTCVQSGVVWKSSHHFLFDGRQGATPSPQLPRAVSPRRGGGGLTVPEDSKPGQKTRVSKRFTPIRSTLTCDVL